MKGHGGEEGKLSRLGDNTLWQLFLDRLTLLNMQQVYEVSDDS